MRSFISAVALLVKVTASVCSNSFRPLRSKSRMYSTVSVNVLPAPAEALYIDNVLFTTINAIDFLQIYGFYLKMLYLCNRKNKK